jgi:hypothetical protein
MREAESANQFGSYLRKQTGWNVSIPDYQEEFILN